MTRPFSPSRRTLLTSGAAALAGAAAGACTSPSAAPTPGQDAGSERGVQDSNGFSLSLHVHGAFALIPDAGGLIVASARPSAPADPHAMFLILEKGTVSARSAKPRESSRGQYWPLNGETTMDGAETGAIARPHATAVAALRDPYGPVNPDNDLAWNDLVWLPRLGKPAARWREAASAYLALPAGTLRVVGPVGGDARAGRWVFKGRPGGCSWRQALTDRIYIDGRGTKPSLTITTGGSTAIIVEPVDGALNLEIASMPEWTTTPIGEGAPLRHLCLLYAFLDGVTCNDLPAPTFERIPENAAGCAGARQMREPTFRTPGELCPLALFE